jgi:YD repeat-containing protein
MPLSIKRRLTLAASVSLLFFLGGELPGSAQQAASFTYDQRGRLTVFVAPDGTITKYVYDAAGNISSIQRGTAADLMRIDSVTPNTGVVPGNTLTIVGQNFDPVASNNTVLFAGVSGSVPALVTGASATQLTVQVPQGAVTGAIRVQRLGQTATGPVVTIQTLTVASISPTTPVVSGSTITLAGQGFSLNANGNTVSFLGAGGASIPVTVTTADPTQLSLQVPAGAVSGLISVTSGTQTVQGPNTQIQALQVTGVTPAGPYLPGATITLAGQGFSLLPSGNIVTFAGANGTTISVPVTTSNPASLTLQIPQTAVSGALSISVAPQTVAGPNIQLQTLQITSISPSTPVVSGDTITINGQGFSPEVGGNAVRFAGANGATISVNPITATSTQLVAAVPDGIVSGIVSVTAGGQTAQGPILQIQVLQITSVSPTTPVVFGDTITINGQAFSNTLSNNIVGFTGANGSTISAFPKTASRTQLTVDVPAGVVSGQISVSVSPQIASGLGIQIQNVQITSVSPTLVVAGDTITINGQGFSKISSNNIVNFTGPNGTIVSASSELVSPTQITVNVPLAAVSGPISVSVPPQTASGSDIQIQPIQIISIAPATPVVAGSILTINGRFSKTLAYSTVNFSGSNGTTIPVTPNTASETQLTVTVPEGAISGPISLGIPPQTVQGPNLAVLRIISVLPDAPVVSGQVLSITGENFNITAPNKVYFGGYVFASVQTTDPTHLNVQVPLNAGTGLIAVDVGSAVVNGPTVNIIPPAVTSIAPNLPVTTGAILTITGQGFSLLPNANTVTFSYPNNSYYPPVAVATAIDPNHLSFQVPQNVITGSITVKVGSQPVQGLTLQVAGLAIDAISPNIAVPRNSELTITGQGFPTVLYLDNSTIPNASVSFVGYFSNAVQAKIIQTSPTQMVVQVPSNAINGPVTVTTTTQTAVIQSISIKPSQQITTVTPSTNLVPKQIVTIEGQNFNPTYLLNNIVYFPLNGGKIAVNVLSATATQLTVEAPIDFESGSIQVAVDGLIATGPNISPVPLVVSSVSPNVGVAPGQTVLITGQGFNPYQADGSLSPQAQVPQRILVASTDLKIAVGFQLPPAISLTKVFFSDCQGGLVQGTVQAGTSTQLRVLVPSGTCSGPVTVQALGQTVTGPPITSQSSSNSVQIVEVPMPAKMVSFSESVERAGK